MKSTTKNKLEQEIFNGNVNETNKQDYSQLTERIEVEHTPFTLVKHEEKWYILLGKYRLSEEYLTKEIALQDAQVMSWNRIMQVIGIMIQEYK